MKTLLMKKPVLALVGGISLLVGGLAVPALARHRGTDAVAIAPVGVGGCGTQTVTISGTATYSERTQHLVVTLDGARVVYSHGEPPAWVSVTQTVGEGSHTVSATIYDNASHRRVQAQATAVFTVPTCSVAQPSGDSGGAGGGGGGGDGEEHPVAKTVKKPLRVRGVARVSVDLGNLRFLNATFRRVFGRPPTFLEWRYWAQRLVDGKKSLASLYGAMQWQKLHGRAIGK